VLCGAGYYQNQRGQMSCKSCGTGQYADQNAEIACKECGIGQYTDQNATAKCKSCDAGSYTKQSELCCKTSSCNNCTCPDDGFYIVAPAPAAPLVGNSGCIVYVLPMYGATLVAIFLLW